MKKILKRIVFLLSINIFLFGCDSVDRRLTIVNKTSKPIFFILSTDSILDEENPNFTKENKLFLIDKNQDTVWAEQDYFVPPYSENSLEILDLNAWTDFINTDCIDSTAHFFIINAEDVIREPWQKILKENKCLKHYQLKVKDLDKNNWRVIHNF